MDKGKKTMIGRDLGLRAQLAESCAKLREGKGSLHIFCETTAKVFSSLPAFFRGLPDLDASSVLCFDPLLDGILPFSPLSEHLRGLCGSQSYILDDLPSLGLYPRHRNLWSSFLGSVECVESEPVISEEIYQERIFMRKDLGKLLTWAGKRSPRVILCSHAECLPQESLELFKDEEIFSDCPLMLLLCFSVHPNAGEEGEAWSGFFRDELTNGRILMLDGEEDISPLTKSSKADGMAADKKPIDIADYRKFLLFHHYGTVIHWAKQSWQDNNRNPGSLSPQAELEVLEALARASEGNDDIDSALFYGQLLWSQIMIQEIPEQKRRAQCLLAQLFKGKNDQETALKTVYAAWKSIYADCPLEQRAEIEFQLFLLNPRTGQYREVFEGNEDRLADAFTKLGWKNHLAFILTQNLAVMEIYERQGGETARERVLKGLTLAHQEKNLRRLATAYKVLGSLEQLGGKMLEAEKAFLESRAHLSPIARGFELARNDNGLGYFYFLAGKYDSCYQCHTRALKALFRGRHYEETLGTLFNLGRVYLYNNQASEALFCLESILKIMDRLQIDGIPFHSPRNIFSLLGIASLRLGRIAQALEFGRRLDGLEPMDEGNYSSDYQMWYLAVKTAACDSPAAARETFMRMSAAMAQRLSDSRHIYIRLLMDYGDFARTQADEAGSRAVWEEAMRVCADPLCHEAERIVFKARLAGQEVPALKIFPRIEFDPEVVLQFVDQDFNLKRLQRKINELNFLQAWQESLRQENKREGIFEKTTSLICEHFLADEAAVFKLVEARIPVDGEVETISFLQGKLGDPEARLDFLHPRYLGWEGKAHYWEGPERERGSYLPLVFLGRLRYILWISADRRNLSEEDHRILVTAAWQLTVALELLQLQEKLLEAATTDQLTGLSNRAEFIRRLDYHMKMAIRLGPIPKQEFCLLFLDLDHFKHYNDSFGHNAGDLVLKLFSQMLIRVLRTTDMICRYGGDEFIILLPATGVPGGEVTADRILKELRASKSFQDELSAFLESPIDVPEDARLSCSIGVGEFMSKIDTSIDGFIGRVDEAAYLAKRQGRNCYRIAT